MTTMVTIPIHAPASEHAGCGLCAHSERDPSCGGLGRCDEPTVSGERSLVARVEQLLGDCPELGGGLQGGLVGLLRAEAGEVELGLAVGGCASGAQLVHAVFDRLRSALPDTDIYVRQMS
jgi:hypothetical protein